MNCIAYSKAVFHHLKEVTPEIKHYFGILSLLGALKTGEAAGDEAYIQEIVEMLSKFPDEIEHGK